MTDQLWPRRPRPDVGAARTLWRGTPTTPAQLTAARVQLHSAILDGRTQAGHDDVDRLLLVFEELGSNAIRHGRPPAQMTVTATGWLIDASDAAGDSPPRPAVDRDAAHGGLGLYLVARLCDAHGWQPHPAGKTVWACLAARGGESRDDHDRVRPSGPQTAPRNA